jgi:hypothetical protein
MRKKIIQKEFTKAIHISNRRKLADFDQISGIYEYCWDLGGITCWKPLKDSDILL